MCTYLQILSKPCGMRWKRVPCRIMHTYMYLHIATIPRSLVLRKVFSDLNEFIQSSATYIAVYYIRTYISLNRGGRGVPVTWSRNPCEPALRYDDLERMPPNKLLRRILLYVCLFMYRSISWFDSWCSVPYW